jgi:Domain of unknown function (DUF4956)
MAHESPLMTRAYARLGRAMTALELADLAVRLLLDLVAVVVLVYGIYRPRHGRNDLAVIYVMFNVGLFLAVVVITRGEVGLGVGLGLFALLSMVRLRSETYTNRELGYFFIALVLALVTSVDVGTLALAPPLAAVALAVAWTVDHPRVSPPAQRTEITLELVLDGREALLRHLRGRLHTPIVDARTLEIDYVRETTRAEVWTRASD